MKNQPGLKYLGFPNGMTIEEGTERAGKWWDEKGRIIILKAFEQSEAANDADRSSDDGLMKGLLFEQLNVREKHKVVTNWYDNIGQYL